MAKNITAREFLSSRQEARDKIAEDYGVDRWTGLSYDLKRQADDFSNYLNSGKFTTADTDRYRSSANKAVEDLTAEMGRYGKSSDRYKQMDSYRQYYQNSLDTFDRLDVGTKMQDYINDYDTWRSQEDYDLQKKSLQDSLTALDAEMEKIEDKNSADYKALQSYRDWYASYEDALNRRAEQDSWFDDVDDYTAYKNSTNYKHVADVKNTYSTKLDEIKAIDPKILEMDTKQLQKYIKSLESDYIGLQAYGGTPEDIQTLGNKIAKLNELVANNDLDNLKAMQTEIQRLEKYGVENIQRNYGGAYNPNIDYQAKIDELNAALEKAKGDPVKSEEISAQIRAIAGVNGDGTNADGLYDEHTWLGRQIMENFDVEAAQKRIDEIDKELEDLGLPKERWLALAIDKAADLNPFAGTSLDPKVQAEKQGPAQESDEHVMELRREKTGLTQKMNSSERQQGRSKIETSKEKLTPERLAELTEAGKGQLDATGKFYSGKDGVKSLGVLRDLTKEFGDSKTDQYYAARAQEILDMVYAAIGAEKLGVDIGYTADEALKAYEAQINDIAGYRRAAEVNRIDGDFWRWNAQVFGQGGLVGGAISNIQNLPDLFTDEYRPESRTQSMIAHTGEMMGDQYDKLVLPGGKNLAQTIHEAAVTTGNMLPSIGLSAAVTALAGPAGLSTANAALAGKIAGAIEMGLTSGGQSYQQMLGMGYDAADARAYGVAMGAAEVGTQYFLGGISKLGGVSEEALLNLTKRIGNGILRAAADTTIHNVSEISEELIQNRLERYMQYSLFDQGGPDFMSWTEDDWYTVVVTALSTTAMEGPGVAINSYRTNQLGLLASGKKSYSEAKAKGLMSAKLNKQEKARRALASEIGKAMQGDEALSYTLKAIGSSMDEGTNARELADLMEAGKIPANARNLGELFGAILSETTTEDGKHLDFDKFMAKTIGGAIKFNEIERAKQAEGDTEKALNDAGQTLAAVKANNPGAAVLNKTASALSTQFGADPVKSVETAAVINKIRNGTAISSREMEQITGNTAEAKAARAYLAQQAGGENISVTADAAVTEAMVNELIKTNREQKKLIAEQTKAEVLAAATEAGDAAVVNRAAAGAVTKITAEDVKALQGAKRGVQEAERAAEIAKTRKQTVNDMSFEQMSERAEAAREAARLLEEGVDPEKLPETLERALLTPADAKMVEDLRSQNAELQKTIDELSAVKMPSRAQSSQLASARGQLAENKARVDSILKSAAEDLKKRSAEIEKAEAESKKAEEKTEEKPKKKGKKGIPPKQKGEETVTLPSGNTMTRAEFNGTDEEWNNMVAQSGGSVTEESNEQTTDNDQGRNALGGQRDGAADQERGDRPEQGSDAGGDRSRRKLSTFDGSREVEINEEVDSDATVTHNDDVSGLEESHPGIREFTDSLMSAGFKRITYVSNGNLYNIEGEAVPGFYNNGELFLSLDPHPGWAGYEATAEHEKLHLKLDFFRQRFGAEEADNFISSSLQNILGEASYIDAFRKYWKRYSPVYLRNNDIQTVAYMVNEEMLCDMIGGIDNFDANLSFYQDSLQDILDASNFNSVADALANRPDENPGTVTTEALDPGAMPHNVPVDTLISGENVDTPSTLPADPGNVSKLAFYGLASALGFKVDETHPKSKVYYLNDEDARLGRNGFTQITVDMIKASPIGNMIRYAQDKGYITEDQAEQEYNLFASIGSISDQTHDFYQAMQFMGSTIFTALKMNSDPQYGTTYDFPSICTKTQAVIDDMSAQMVSLKRALTEDEIIEIYQRQFTAGNPVPCPECYVFSRWVGIGGLLDNINYYQDTYGSMTPEEVARIYEENAEKVAKAAEAAGVNFGKQKSKMAAELQKKYNTLKEKREKAESVGKAVSKKAVADEEVLRRQMSDIRSLSWIDNVYFGGKAHLAKNVNKNFRVPTEILFNLNEGETFARDYKEAWAFRTTQGAGYGKAITPYAEAILGEGIQITKGNGAIKLKADGKLDHVFLSETGEITDKSERGKTLKAAIKKQLNQLFIGGQRFQSTSDARFDNAVDYLLAGLEMQTMHGGVQVYTKVPGAVHFFNLLGMCTNMSLMPKGSGLDENGVPVDTTTGGMNPETAMILRLGNEYAGTITIGVNDAHIRAMFNQAFRDFIIPYHASGGKAALVSEFRRIQEGRAVGEGEMPQSTDYTNTQTDKFVTDEILRNDLGYTEAEIEDVRKFRATRIYILTNGSKRVKNNTFYREMLDTSAEGLTESQINARRILQQLYVSMQEGGDWHGVELSKGLVEGQIFPNEFWDTSVSYDESGVNTQRYLDYCKALGVLHRFSGKGVKTGNVTNKDGTVTRRGYVYNVTGRDQHGNEVALTDLAYKNGKDGEIEPFFWKTLTDRRMYGNQGQYLKQPRVDLTNLKAEDVVTFAAPMGERRYNRKDALRVAAQPLQNSQSRNSAQLTPGQESRREFSNKSTIPAKNAPKKQTAQTEKPATEPHYSIQGEPATAQQAQTYYSQQDAKVNDWAPEFYSKMQRTIEDWTGGNGKPMGAKMAANQVLSWLKGKGVKAEEIKWSGIIPYLEGKKTVTKDELLQVMAENEIKIETKVLGSGGTAFDVWHEYEHYVMTEDEIRDAAVRLLNEGYYSGYEKPNGEQFTVDDVDVVPQYDGGIAVLSAETGEVLLDGNRTISEGDTHWMEYSLPGGENYREILFMQPGNSYTNRAMQMHWGTPGVLAHARVQDMYDQSGLNDVLMIEEIQSDLHNAGAAIINKNTKEKRGFAPQDGSAEEHEAARRAKLQELRSKTKETEARFRKADKELQDMYEQSGEVEDNVLEILAGAFVPDALTTFYELTSRGAVASWIFNETDGLGFEPPGPLSDFAIRQYERKYGSTDRRLLQSKAAEEIDNALSEKDRAWIEKARSVVAEYNDAAKADMQATRELEDFTDTDPNTKQPPDVPFAGSSDTYHEYVMKHLLRLAAEGGYDRLAWTTAQQQSDRWSDEYEDGYRIEYDQNIPKFMNKYVKQWGGKVGTTELDNGEEVWSVDITPEMRDSVLHEGQPLFSIQNDSSVDSLYPEGTLQRDILDVLQTEGSEGLTAWVNEQKAKHEDALENAKIKAPAIPSKGFAPPVSAKERALQRSTLEALINRYGTMKPSEKSNGFVLPPKNQKGQPLRRHIQNVLSSENISDEARDHGLRFTLTNANATYVPDSNDALIKDAKDDIKEMGLEHALASFKRDASKVKLGTKGILQNIALGEQLLLETSSNGDMANFIDVLSSVCELGTTIGKSLQAFRLLKQSGPIGQLYYVQKAVDRMNKQNEERMKRGKFKELVVKDDLAKAVINAKTEEERDAAMKALIADIASQTPATFFDRWNAWRYLAMLGNARTHVRNIVGNAFFAPLRYVKDVMAAGGEFLATKAGWMEEQDRTKALSVSRELRDFAAEDAEIMRQELQGNGKYNPTQEILKARRLLPGFLDALSRKNGDLLELEDWWFLKGAYARALAMQLSHMGYTTKQLTTTTEGQEALNRARKTAILEAQKATYRDFVAAASWLNRGKHLTGAAGTMLSIGLEGVLPFTKTPINILRRGVEYSPLGIAKGIGTVLSGLKNGNLDVAEAIDRLAAGLTGTGVAVLGLLLARMGVLRGKKGDDDEENFDKMQGMQDYSLQLGDQSFTIDWAAPSALPLFTGAAINELLEDSDGELGLKDIWNSIMMIAEPMTSLSMLDGLNKLIESTAYASGNEKIATIAAQAATSYFGQAFPTILGQVARSIDGTRRSTYVDKNSPIPAAGQRFIQTSVQGKIPGWENAKVPYIDAWGRTSEPSSKVLNGIENFFAPWYRNTKQVTDVDEELKDLYSKTKADILPSVPQKYFSVGGEKKYLTADEWVSYATDVGQTKYDLMTQLISDPRYVALDDTKKAKVIKDYIYKYAGAVGKFHVDPNYDIHGTGVWIEEAEAAATDYERFERIWQQIEKTLKD